MPAWLLVRPSRHRSSSGLVAALLLAPASLRGVALRASVVELLSLTGLQSRRDVGVEPVQRGPVP